VPLFYRSDARVIFDTFVVIMLLMWYFSPLSYKRFKNRHNKLFAKTSVIANKLNRKTNIHSLARSARRLEAGQGVCFRCVRTTAGEYNLPRKYHITVVIYSSVITTFTDTPFVFTRKTFVAHAIVISVKNISHIYFLATKSHINNIIRYTPRGPRT